MHTGIDNGPKTMTYCILFILENWMTDKEQRTTLYELHINSEYVYYKVVNLLQKSEIVSRV